MAPAAPHNLPVELIEAVVDAVDSHNDLLSFALTCSHLHDIIEKNGYFEYRELVVAYGHTHVWKHLVANPQLAAKVRTLHIYDNNLITPKHRTFWRIPATVSRNVEIQYYARPSLEACLPSLTGLEAIIMHPVTPPGQPSSLIFTIFSCLDAKVSSLTLILSGPDVLDVNDLLWNSQGLRALDLSTTEFQTDLDADLWSSYCSLLSLNPRLEDLRVPTFLGDVDYRAKLPPLPRLRVLHIGNQGESTSTQLAFFAAAHPSITEFSWDSQWDVPPGYIPNLSRLGRLVNTSPHIVHTMLSGRAPGSVPMSELGRFALSTETLPVLSALRASTLRALTLESVDSRQTLASFATKFPDIEELHILSPMLGNGWLRSIMSPSRLELEEVLQLFPKLRVVSGVAQNVSNTGEAVRRAHPLLRVVNGSRFNRN